MPRARPGRRAPCRGLRRRAGAVVVRDGGVEIAALLARLADAGHRLILTTGGTGLTPTDVTPAATRRVIDREAASRS